MSYHPLDIIKNAIDNEKLSHAYLFYGDKGVDVEKYSFEAIKMVIESSGRKIEANNIDELKYFDIQIIKPIVERDNQIIKENVDNSIAKLFETSLEKNAIKILYIHNVDLGNKNSLNRLLKFVEEPVDDLVIIMDTNHFDKVLSTIKSRTQNIYINRENINQKIKLMKSVEPNLTALVANIFANLDQLKSIDNDMFKKTYLSIIEAFKHNLKTKHSFKTDMYELWNKSNNDIVLSVLQFFFYQLMVEIDKKNPLFPNQNSLINEYKKKNLDINKIQVLIEQTKKNLHFHANFNLQKIVFLNELEEILL